MFLNIVSWSLAGIELHSASFGTEISLFRAFSISHKSLTNQRWLAVQEEHICGILCLNPAQHIGPYLVLRLKWTGKRVIES